MPLLQVCYLAFEGFFALLSLLLRLQEFRFEVMYAVFELENLIHELLSLFCQLLITVLHLFKLSHKPMSIRINLCDLSLDLIVLCCKLLIGRIKLLVSHLDLSMRHIDIVELLLFDLELSAESNQLVIVVSRGAFQSIQFASQRLDLAFSILVLGSDVLVR